METGFIKGDKAFLNGVEYRRVDSQKECYCSNFGVIVQPVNKEKTEFEVIPQMLHRDNYYQVTLSRQDKIYKPKVHRIVAMLWCENDDPELCTVVDHIDGNTHNNCAANLEWVTPLENNLRSVYKGRPNKGKCIICNQTGKIYKTQKEAAADCNIERVKSVGDSIRSRKPVKGFTFDYIDPPPKVEKWFGKSKARGVV